MTEKLTPTKPRAGKVQDAQEPERIQLANDGTRVADLVGVGLLLQPLRSEEWETVNGRRSVVVTRVVEFDEHSQWTDHGDLPIFWGVVRRSLEEQSNDEYPWVVGRIVKRPQKPNAKRNSPYILEAPSPRMSAVANAVLEEWRKTPEPEFEPADADTDDGDDGEPF